MSFKNYSAVVKDLLKATPEPALSYARHLRDHLPPSAEMILEQKLISFRLALKNGLGASLNVEDISPEASSSAFLKGETYFVRSLVLIHKNMPQEAAESFTKASEFYSQEQFPEKSLLCLFNAMIALSNAGLLSAKQELSRCKEILSIAQERGLLKIQGLCLRQKSYCYFSSGRYRAALQEISMALPILEIHGPVSDHHLALIHAADCSLELQQIDQANTFLDYLPADIDNRIYFPRAYVQAKINLKTLDLSNFEDINSHWKSRYDNYLQKQHQTATTNLIAWEWDVKSHRLTDGNKKLITHIKPLSLEGNLLKLLMKGPRTKELLCEVLWPEVSTSAILDDRFFRLKNRLQKKIRNTILFDGQQYSLKSPLQWR